MLGCSYWLLYKGRCACVPSSIVRDQYNHWYPSRKSCSSSITNTAFSGTEPNTRKTDMTERLSKRVRQSYGTEMGWGVQTPVSNVGTSRKQTIEQKPLCNKILNAMHCTPTFLASLCEGKMSCRVPQWQIKHLRRAHRLFIITCWLNCGGALRTVSDISRPALTELLSFSSLFHMCNRV